MDKKKNNQVMLDLWEFSNGERKKLSYTLFEYCQAVKAQEKREEGVPNFVFDISEARIAALFVLSNSEATPRHTNPLPLLSINGKELYLVSKN